MQKFLALAGCVLITSLSAHAQDASIPSLTKQAREASARKDWPAAAAAWEKAAPLMQGGTGFYNAACARALQGETALALALLEKAEAGGFSNLRLLEKDEDLASLRGEAGFKAVVQKVARRAEPCRFDSEARRFDFWVGDWDVHTPSGDLAGRNTIESILGGCVLLESWTGSRGVSGKSLNFLDQTTGRWKQTWVDDKGGYTEYVDGVASDGVVAFRATRAKEKVNGKDALVERKLTFTRQSADLVRQLGEISTDGGKTWSVDFDLAYRRRK